MKIYFKLLLCYSLFCITNLQSQTVYVSGNINFNTTWNADTIKLIDDVTIIPNVILTIAPGTYIEAQGYYGIIVNGSIKAIGNPSDSIVFTVKDTTNFWIDSLSVAGGWAGIKLVNSIANNDTSVFQYCKIQYGKKYDSISYTNIKGGAICANDYHSLIIKNSLFFANRVIFISNAPFTARGGAIFAQNVYNLIIENNNFTKNRSHDAGGAIFIFNRCTALIDNNLFILNNSFNYFPLFTGGVGTGGEGACIAISDTSHSIITISNNKMFNNLSVNGVIYIMSNKADRIFNNVICNNDVCGIMEGWASGGPHIYKKQIFNNTIVNNRAWEGIFVSSNPFLYNNIIWNNLWSSTSMDNQISFNFAHGYILTHNCVQYGNGGDSVVTDNPQFTKPTLGIGTAYKGYEADWSLQLNSPCINTGTFDTLGLLLPLLDIEGNPRIFNGRIDIGAYESQHILSNANNFEVLNKDAFIFPNPGSNFINVYIAQQIKEQVTFEMFDFTGKKVMQENIQPTSNATINTSILQSGMYFYRIRTSKKEIGCGKWIKVN